MKSKRTPSKHKPWAIVQHWLASADRERFAPRLNPGSGEPHCFVCGWRPEHETTGWSATHWNRTGNHLDRAHIIPHSLGGPDELSNLIMLCTPCHKDSPDWPDPSEMEIWISGQPRRLGWMYDRIMAWADAMESVTGGFEVVHLPPGVFNNVFQAKLELAGLHAGELSQGTRVAVMRAVCAELFEQRRDPDTV